MGDLLEIEIRVEIAQQSEIWKASIPEKRKIFSHQVVAFEKSFREQIGSTKEARKNLVLDFRV